MPSKFAAFVFILFGVVAIVSGTANLGNEGDASITRRLSGPAAVVFGVGLVSAGIFSLSSLTTGVLVFLVLMVLAFVVGERV